MPNYRVTIYERSIRHYEVEAKSPSHVKQMYEYDENSLGTPYDSDIISWEAEVVCPDGKLLVDSEIPDLEEL